MYHPHCGPLTSAFFKVYSIELLISLEAEQDGGLEDVDEKRQVTQEI
jgi:hypothetical protein